MSPNYLQVLYEFKLKYLIVCLTFLEKFKIIIYPLFFAIYFFMYYSIVIPQVFFTFDKDLIDSINDSFNNNTIKIVMICINSLLLFIILAYGIYDCFFNKNVVKKVESTSTWGKIADVITNKIFILVFIIFVISIISFINIICFYDKISFISNSNVLNTVFYVVSIIFYILFISFFIFNLFKNSSDYAKYFPCESDKKITKLNLLNEEFIISVVVILVFLIGYIILSYFSMKSIFYNLKEHTYSIITPNCDPSLNSIGDNFDNLCSDKFNQINNIIENHGSNYLKLKGNIPVAFLNPVTGNYQDLILADFYYPGSYYTYLADSPLNGTPDLNAIKIALTNYKARIIHLDIYSNSSDPNDIDAEPVVRCKKENMKKGAKELDFSDCLGVINKYAWLSTCNDISYPLFLILNFNFDDNKYLYIRIYELLMKYFSKYLIDKKYSFSGRNGDFPLSNATLKECLGKIIIISNKYPTKCVLDEIINSSTNTLNYDFNLKLYKKEYIKFSYENGPGLSQDYNKNDLINTNKKNINLFYSEPNIEKQNNNQAKSGIFNPSFQDAAQYGCQATLMYLFTNDDNFQKWYLYFKTKNNFDPVLKDEILRGIDGKEVKIVKQDPLLNIQAPQNYKISPMIDASFSNISANPTNISHNTK